MKVHSCNYCSYQSDRLYNLKVHHKNKHGNQPYQATTKMSVGPNGSKAPTTVLIPPLYGNGVQAAATHQHTSNPHPHVHPYLNHTNQSIPSNWFIAQHPHEYEYGKEIRAPTKVSVSPDYPSAPMSN